MKAISHTRRACIHVAARVALGLGFVFGNTGLCAQSIDALQLITKIPLGAVVGRIDHLALDVPRHRLYIAALGNHSLRANRAGGTPGAVRVDG